MADSTNKAKLPTTFAQSGLERFVPYLMNRIMGRYNANIRAQMSALGLSTAKMRALAVLSVHDGVPINTLSVYSVVEQSTLSRALDGLQSDGLVMRAEDPEDQRSFRIFLTDAGRAVNDQLWPHMRDSQERMLEGISDQEREAFLSTLHKILENIRVHKF